MGIYSYELYKFYDVDTIIRIGSAGAYTDEIKIYDVLLTLASYSESTFGKVQNGDSTSILYSSDEINKKIIETAEDLSIELKRGTIHSSDVFYKENDNFKELYENMVALLAKWNLLHFSIMQKHLIKSSMFVNYFR